MSLNRYELAVFDYWERQPDERRHWQARVREATGGGVGQPGEAARALERELWEYFIERCPHVPLFRDLQPGGLRRVSLLNLAEHILRLWSPPPKPKNPPPGSAF